jgi:APA family basic amino acid/polyamine antiporter
MAFGSYLQGVFPAVSPLAASVSVVVFVTLFHLRDLRVSSVFQIFFTVLKIGLVLFLIAALFAAPATAPAASAPWGSYLLTAPFAVSLMFTLYAYSGWNAATYILGEVRAPGRVIPRALVAGTLLVMLLYLGLNAAFLHAAPTSALAGKLNVAQVAAESSVSSPPSAPWSGLDHASPWSSGRITPAPSVGCGCAQPPAFPPSQSPRRVF